MNCCLKYTFNTRLPSHAISPLNTFPADSSNTYPSCVGALSSSVTLTLAAVVHSLSTELVAVSEYAPSA